LVAGDGGSAIHAARNARAALADQEQIFEQRLGATGDPQDRRAMCTALRIVLGVKDHQAWRSST
jgi:hypothetical protein